MPLEEGVTVIAAHACSFGLMLYEKYLPTFLELVRDYAHFYADVSALALPNRFKMLLLLQQHPEVQDRLLFGTDYPLSVFHLPALDRVGINALSKIVQTANRFDRQFYICQSLGIKFGSFHQVMGQGDRG